MFGWWYTGGLKWVVARAGKRLNAVHRMFSVGILLRTLFAPWKQIVGTPNNNQTLDDKFRMKLDNLISRFVGLGVRTLTLLAAFVSLTFVLTISLPPPLPSSFSWPFSSLSLLLCHSL